MIAELYLGIGLFLAVVIMAFARRIIIRLRRQGEDWDEVFWAGVSFCVIALVTPVIWGVMAIIALVLWAIGATTLPEVKAFIIKNWKGKE